MAKLSQRFADMIREEWILNIKNDCIALALQQRACRALVRVGPGRLL